MGIFTLSTIFVIIIICAISAWSTIVVARRSRLSERDEVSLQRVGKHPLMFNPIILVYIVVGLFMTIVIFYFWANSRG